MALRPRGGPRGHCKPMGFAPFCSGQLVRKTTSAVPT